MSGILIIVLLVILIALLLSNDNLHDDLNNETLIDAVDKLLPQTQCGKCSYSGCRPYAEAIVQGQANINQCPPGGMNTIRQLADLLGHTIKPLDPRYGKSGPKTIAYIDEDVCIGCVKCIRACPVDAIVGAPKQMHTIIPELCTGCELCIPPCPVDCISLMIVTHPGKRIKLEPARQTGEII